MQERAIHNVLTQGRTVQKGGSNPPNSPGKLHPDLFIPYPKTVLFDRSWAGSTPE